MKRFAKILLCMVFAIGLVYAPVYLPAVENTPAVTVADAATVKISKKSATMYVGTTLQLKMNGTSKKATWSTSKKAVATVANGKVTAKKAGTATITAKVGKKSYTCKVTVKAAPKLNLTKKTVYVGAKTQLKLNGYKIGTVKWTTSNKKVATVSSSGLVTAKKTGTATIKAAVGGKTLSFKATVKAVPTLNKKTATVTAGNKVQLKLNGTAIGTVKWTTSSSSVATVNSSGLVTAKKAGTATIKATVGGKTLSCKVTVKKAYIPVDYITFNAYRVYLDVGQTQTVTVSVNPSNATNKTVKWSSDNPSIAKVDANGKVTAVGVGETKIHAEADGKSDYCYITVTAPEVESVELDQTRITLDVGGTKKLKATINPSNAEDQTVEWSSSDKKIATVDANGNVTAISAGTTKITAKAGYKSATCTVTVVAPTFQMGEVWEVPGQWRLKINSVETHYKCNQFNKNPGVQVVTINYTYWCDGPAFYSSGLNFSSMDFKVYDEEGEAGSSYPCTHDLNANRLTGVGQKCTASESFILINQSDSLTLNVDHYDVDFVSQQARFELDFGAAAEPEEPEDEVSSVSQNLTDLKNYIRTYGSTNTSGNKFISKTTSGSTTTTAGIIYKSAENVLSFVSTSTTDDTQAAVEMNISLNGNDKVKPEILFIYEEFGVAFESHVNFAPDSYDGSEDVYFTVDSYIGAISNSDIQGLSNSLLKLGFASWENLLVTKPQMSLTDLGFTSYEL